MKKYILIFIILITSLYTVQGQSINQNYVKTTVYKKGFQEGVVGMAENNEKMETVQYFDGLGRPSQRVSIRQGGNKLENNIIDWKNTWTLGSGSAPFFVKNGATSENQRVNGTDPYGDNSILWQCGNDSSYNADGGWNTDYFNIDNTVGYRYTVWVKRSGSQNGTTFHGTNNVNKLDGSVIISPYFWSGDMPNLDQWYLLVGVIHPNSYSGVSTGVSGVYDINGTKVKSGTEFKWSSSTETSNFTSYLNNATNVSVRQYFYDPLVQKLDGNEASIEEIIAGTNMADIITPIEYDVYGRQVKDYLPYSEATNDGLYRTDALTGVSNYYNTTKYENTLNPYSEKLFDKTPLNLIVETAAPGNAWKEGIQEEHTVKNEYKLIENSDEVNNFRVNYDTNGIPQLIDKGLFTIGEAFQGDGYRAPTLYKFIIKNENWVSLDGNDNTTQTFKDYRGRTLLNRTFESGEAHDTYYVYDNYGNLCFVIPPKVTVVNGIDNTELNELCYQYIYDDKNRLIEKKIPGKGWEYIIYNKIDQPVLTQNTIQKSKKEWLFTKYDAFGRVVYSGIYIHSAIIDQKTMQGILNAETILFEQSGSTLYNYTNNAFPQSIVNNDILTINYYDDYSFNLPAGLSSTITSYGVTSTANVKGLPTGSKVKVLGTSSWITTVTYYDDQKRPIYVYTKNDYLGTTDIVESKLIEYTDDIRGLVHETTTTHQKGATSIVTIDKFTYDHTGRMLTQIQKINSQADEKIVQNNYDDLGQLIGKDVGGKTTKTALQNIEYKYNIRGWLKNINDVNNIGSDLFAFQLNYNDIADVNKKLYNGNISQSFWRTANTDSSLKDYEYLYDALNRITGAIDNTGNYNLDLVQYDKNGNITKLKRQGHLNTGATNFGIMDDLTYSYDSGNKLMKVADAATIDQFGFKDDAINGAADTSDDYSYDTNGNLLTDTNKGITSILYNHLNLPTEIKFDNSNTKKINYTYSADGLKLKKVVNDGGILTTTDYANGYIYENSTLQFFNHPEGYVNNDNGTFKYVYNYLDHLGSIRLSYSDGDGNGSISQSEIIQENHYYPYGLKLRGFNSGVSSLGNSTAQKYMFNGKEFDDSFNETLNTYDFGARNYDPALGRWMNLDPLAELMTRHSPYNYAFNNPIYFIDPDGMFPREQDDFDGQPQKKKDSRSEEFFNGVTYTSGSFNGNSFSFSGKKEDPPSKYQQFFRSISGEVEREVANSGFGQDENGQADGDTLDRSTVGQNFPLIGGRSTYAGNNNPRTKSGKYTYSYAPTMLTDFPAIGHDRRYDNLEIEGWKGWIFDTRAIGADLKFVGEQLSIMSLPFDPATRINAGILAVGLGVPVIPKTLYQMVKPNGLIEMIMWYNISNNGVTNKPGN